MISWQKRLWALINNGMELVLGIGMVAVVTRLASAQQTGTWFLFMAIFALASAMRDALIQSALVKLTTAVDEFETHAGLRTTLATALFFELATSSIMITVGFLLQSPLGELLLFYPLYALPSTWLRWQTFYLRAQTQVRTITMSNASQVLVLLVGVLILWQTQFSLPLLLMLLGLANLTGGALLAQHLPYRAIWQSKVSADGLRTIRQMGFYGMLREATIAISSRVSLFYTSGMLSMAQTGLLGVAQRFAQIGLLPNNAFQSLLFPSLMYEVKTGTPESLRIVFEKSIAQLLALTLPMAVIGSALSPLVLLVLSGEQYVSAWPLLITYLTLAIVITPFGTAFGSLVTAIGKPQLAFRVVLVNSILNTLLGYLCIRYVGLVGAPLALAVTEVWGVIWVSRIVNAETGIRFSRVFKLLPGIYLDQAKRIRRFLDHQKFSLS